MINQKAKFLSLIIFTVLFSFNLKAQNEQRSEAKGPEARAKKKTEWMKTELSLTNEQTTKVGDINLKYAKKNKEKREEMKKQMKALHDEQKKELSQVLTKEQSEKLEAKRKEMKEKRKEHHMKGKKDCGLKKEGEKKK